MIQLGILTILSLIVYEDFKFRAVRLIIFPVLLCLLLIEKVTLPVDEVWLIDTAINIGYILLIFLLAYAYFCLKRRSFINPFSLLGGGDLLLFLLLTVWFDPVTFILFNTITFILSGATHVILKHYKFYRNPDSIPLAGIQSACFILVFMFHFFA